MNHAVIVNLAIISIVAFTIWLTSNPLALLILLLLKDLPYGLHVEQDDDEEKGNPIGFIQSGEEK